MARVNGALLAAVLACSSNAGAELAGLVQSLRSEPMTLFDWGLYLLEEELQGVLRNDFDFIRAVYNPKSERIAINSVFLVSKEEIKTLTAARACYTRHHAIKLVLGVIDTDRIHLAPAADFRMGAKFSHHNSDAFGELPDAANVGRMLLDALDINVALSETKDEFPFNQTIRCSGAAMSQEIDYSGETVVKMLDDARANQAAP